MAKVTEKLNLKFYLNIVHLNVNLNSHMWPVAAILNSIVMEEYYDL